MRVINNSACEIARILDSEGEVSQVIIASGKRSIDLPDAPITIEMTGSENPIELENLARDVILVENTRGLPVGTKIEAAEGNIRYDTGKDSENGYTIEEQFLEIFDCYVGRTREEEKESSPQGITFDICGYPIMFSSWAELAFCIFLIIMTIITILSSIIGLAAICRTGSVITRIPLRGCAY